MIRKDPSILDDRLWRLWRVKKTFLKKWNYSITISLHQTPNYQLTPHTEGLSNFFCNLFFQLNTSLRLHWEIGGQQLWKRFEDKLLQVKYFYRLFAMIWPSPLLPVQINAHQYIDSSFTMMTMMLTMLQASDQNDIMPESHAWTQLTHTWRQIMMMMMVSIIEVMMMHWLTTSQI